MNIVAIYLFSFQVFLFSISITIVIIVIIQYSRLSDIGRNGVCDANL